MMRSLTLGQFQDIDVRIHPSFGLIPAWVLFNWGTGDQPGFTSLAYTVLLVALVFSLVVVHEFGHSLMAQQHGLRVRDITLVPFGGVARIEHMPGQPKTEAIIALAGPAVNFALAMLLLPVVIMIAVVNDYGSPGAFIAAGFDQHTLASIVIFVFMANIILFAFNLLPAFPMDGGRLLRAGLSPAIGREHATNAAVWIGMVIAILMIAGGIWLRDWLLPLAGIFVIIAAWAEGRAVRLESSLRRMLAGQFAVWDRGGIAPSEPVTLALSGGLKDMVVTDQNKVLGIAWRRDLLHALNTGRAHQQVLEIMDTDIVTASIGDSVYDVYRLMQDNNQWAVPILEGDTYRGIFTADRFSHIYRQLKSQTVENRQMTSVKNTLQSSWNRMLH